MRAINNFDTSSTGTNIEVIGGYSNDLSQMYLDNNFERLLDGSLYYMDWCNVEESCEVTFSIKANKLSLAKLLADYYGNSISFYMRQTKDEILSDAEDILDEFMTITDYRDFNKDNSDIKIIPNKELIWIESRGYSQGDYAEIVYSCDDLKDCWGVDVDERELSKTIDNLLWGAPIDLIVIIDGDEYDYGDTGDTYEYQREMFIDVIAKESGVKRDVLENIIPEELEY